MALSFDRYTGDGADTTWAISWERLSDDHVKAALDGVLTVDFSVVANDVVFDVAPGNNVDIVLFRETSIGTRLTTFVDGSFYLETDFNTDSLQSYYLAQENRDRIELVAGSNPGDGDISIREGEALSFNTDTTDDTDILDNGSEWQFRYKGTQVLGIDGTNLTTQGVTSVTFSGATTDLFAGRDITASLGDIKALNGDIEATLGNINAAAGDIQVGGSAIDLEYITGNGATTTNPISTTGGAADADLAVFEQTTTSHGARLRLRNDSGNEAQIVLPQSTSSIADYLYLVTPTDGGFRVDSDNGSSRLIDITKDGEVGLGTLGVPGTALTVPGAVDISGITTIPNGSAGAPAIAFASDTDTGVYKVGTGRLGVAAGGSLILDVNGASTPKKIDVHGVARAADGSAAAPAFSFINDTDTGAYRSVNNEFGITAAGTKVAGFNATGLDVTGNITATGTVTSSGSFRTLQLDALNIGKGSTAPTEVTIGSTPSIKALKFDATNETASMSFVLPSDYDVDVDPTFALVCNLATGETNGDVLSWSADYVVTQANSTGSGFDKTSTATTWTTTVTTANGLATNDQYVSLVTLDRTDATNPIDANSLQIGIEIHLTNVTGVADINVTAARLVYGVTH